jgi:type I restriction enzyme M protein
MTPRGGIKPHNRFPIQAKRSEVLFVDYITEHLTPNGKAGIIVPEGIIFQSGNVYKQLRKMLVEDGLWAVVSLPQGVFNPYSGVKTSILFFNNTIARKTKEILFIKVENDGYDLGAQRRPIDKNDLPTRLILLNKYKKSVQDNKKFNLSKDEEVFASVVKKDKIAENGDYNLSASNYLVAIDYSNVKWPIVELGEIAEVRMGETLIKADLTGKGRPIFSADISQKPWNYTDKTKLSFGKDTIVIGARGTIGSIKLPNIEDFTCTQTTIAVSVNKKIIPEYVFYLLKFFDFSKIKEGVGIPMITTKNVKKIKIPLPPIEVQKEIISELDGYQKIIEGAKQVVDNYSSIIKIDPKWEIKKLGEISDRITKGTTPTTIKFDFQSNGINFVKIETIDDNGCFIDNKFAHINEKCNGALKRSQLKEGDVLFSIAGALGRVAVVNKDILPANTNQALAIITPKANLDPEYLAQVLRSPLIFNKLEGLKVGVAQYNISLAQVSDFEIPIPEIETQKQIVAKIKEEQKSVDVNKELIKLFEQKIKDKISEIWGE